MSNSRYSLQEICDKILSFKRGKNSHKIAQDDKPTKHYEKVVS